MNQKFIWGELQISQVIKSNPGDQSYKPHSYQFRIEEEFASNMRYSLILWKRQVSTQVFLDLAQFIVIHTVKGFGIVNKAEIDVFLELSCFFDDPACWEPAWGILPVAKVMRKGAWENAKVGSGFRGPPWILSSIYPQNQSLPGLLCYAFHLLFWH